MNDFENIISHENLYKAHRCARLGKRHKKEVIEFEANLAENLWSLHYDLKYNKYKIGEYRKFMIYDPKEREIQAIPYKDRIVQHSICDNFLTPLLNRYLIYDNSACRKNKGTSFAIKRLKQFMTKHYKKYGTFGYFVKIDVSKYFASIDHNILKLYLKQIVKDKCVYNLLTNIIDSYNKDTGKGLPMGNQTSQAFALLYLNKLDRHFKEVLKIKNYIRYMDDIIILVHNKLLAKECVSYATLMLQKLKLNINPKSQIIAVKNGIQFLGWNFYFNNKGKIIKSAKKQTKQRIKEKIKLKIKQKAILKITESFVSYKGFFKHSMSFVFFSQLKSYF